jgi:O-antigen/teichoic acid export membrane protein
VSIRKNSLWGLFGTGAPFLIGIISIPYLIRNIGIEAFGVLTLVWLLIGYFSIFDFGLGRGLTQQLSATKGKISDQDVSTIVKSGLLVIFLTGIAGGIVLALIAGKLGSDWLNVSEILKETTTTSMLIASIGIPCATLTAGFRGILEAESQFATVNIYRFFLGIANFLLPSFCVAMGYTALEFIVVSLVLVRVISLFFHAYAANQRLPGKWFKRNTDFRAVSKILSFGAWMTITNIIGPLMVSADKFIISSTLSASIIAYYSVPSEVLMRLLIIPSALASALFPILAQNLSKDIKVAKQVYYKSVKSCLLVMAPLCLLVGIFSHQVLQLWMGGTFADKSWLIMDILSIGVLFNAISFMPYNVIQATGDARTTAIIHTAELMMYLPLLYFLLNRHGVVGAAYAWTIRVLLDMIAMFIFAHKKFQHAGISQ